MTVAKQQYLFGLKGSTYSTFKIYPIEARTGQIRDWIELCGGTCVGSDEDDAFTIPIVDLKWCKQNKINTLPKSNTRDVFKSNFIYDCYTKEKLMDLNLYKLGDSVLTDYDANMILQRKLSWKDVKVASAAAITKETVKNCSNNNSARLPKLLEKPMPASKRLELLNNMSELVQVQESAQDNARDEPNEELCNGKLPASKSVAIEDTSNTSESSTKNSHEDLSVEFTAGKGKETALDNNNNNNKRRLLQPPSSNKHHRRESSAESGHSDDSIETVVTIGKLPIRIPSRLNINPPEDANGAPAPTSNSGPTNAKPATNDKKRPHLRDSSISSTKARRPYNFAEAKALLEYICDNEKHFMTGGNQMWKDMEKEKVLEGRSAQSMKEHFRKKIFPFLDDFKCSKIDKKKFVEAEKVRKGGRRRPQDYKF